MGTSITNSSKSDILKYIFKRIEDRDKKFYIVTPNPEILMYALKHPSYQVILNDAEISIPDGIGVLMSAKILRKKIIGRITGVELMVNLCEEASKRAVNIGFLGGRGSVAERTAECLREKYPSLNIVFANSEWEDGKKLQEHIDILFIAFGFPKQEEWIAKNLERLPVTCAMGVGGAFDYISGRVARAPKFVRSMGMEWAFRLLNEPWRFKRQTALFRFTFQVIKEGIGL